TPNDAGAPLPLTPHQLLLPAELALEDPQHVRRHQRMESPASLERGSEILLQEAADGGEELENGRPVLHGQASGEVTRSPSDRAARARSRTCAVRYSPARRSSPPRGTSAPAWSSSCPHADSL